MARTWELVALGAVGSPVTFTIANSGGTDATNVVVSTNISAFVLGSDLCNGQTPGEDHRDLYRYFDLRTVGTDAVGALSRACLLR